MKIVLNITPIVNISKVFTVFGIGNIQIITLYCYFEGDALLTFTLPPPKFSSRGRLDTVFPLELRLKRFYCHLIFHCHFQIEMLINASVSKWYRVIVSGINTNIL